MSADVGKAHLKTYRMHRVYSLPDGESRFGWAEVDLEPNGEIGDISQLIQGTGVMIRRTEGDYDFSWHTAPRRQLVICLDAAVEMTTSDGTVRTIKPGEIVLLEDTHGKGHYSRAVGNQARHSVFAPIPEGEGVIRYCDEAGSS